MRYVDNTFVVIKEDQVSAFNHSFNLALTNGRFPFLHVLMQKLPSGDLESSVYRKGTNADVVLHHNSNHSTCHKRRCIKTLFSKVDTHCSSHEAHRQDKTYLHLLFHDNGYPPNFITRALRQRPLPSTQNISDEKPYQCVDPCLTSREYWD